jgi:hypothetical protein
MARNHNKKFAADENWLQKFVWAGRRDQVAAATATQTKTFRLAAEMDRLAACAPRTTRGALSFHAMVAKMALDAFDYRSAADPFESFREQWNERGNTDR